MRSNLFKYRDPKKINNPILFKKNNATSVDYGVASLSSSSNSICNPKACIVRIRVSLKTTDSL